MLFNVIFWRRRTDTAWINEFYQWLRIRYLSGGVHLGGEESWLRLNEKSQVQEKIMNLIQNSAAVIATSSNSAVFLVKLVEWNTMQSTKREKLISCAQLSISVVHLRQERQLWTETLCTQKLHEPGTFWHLTPPRAGSSMVAWRKGYKNYIRTKAGSWTVVFSLVHIHEWISSWEWGKKLWMCITLTVYFSSSPIGMLDVERW